MENNIRRKYYLFIVWSILVNIYFSISELSREVLLYIHPLDYSYALDLKFYFSSTCRWFLSFAYALIGYASFDIKSCPLVCWDFSVGHIQTRHTYFLSTQVYGRLGQGCRPGIHDLLHLFIISIKVTSDSFTSSNPSFSSIDKPLLIVVLWLCIDNIHVFWYGRLSLGLLIFCGMYPNQTYEFSSPEDWRKVGTRVKIRRC